jgi:shikimate dehydrogenase
VLIGDPVDHSLSPVMHNAAIAALGLDAVYIALKVDKSALPHVLRALEALGVAGNVTVPHKVSVASLLIRVTSLAKELGAVNTFWPEGGRLVGDNTDVRGLMDAVVPLDPEGPWLVMGAGGAARAVAIAAREIGVPLFVKSRDRERAADFAAWASDAAVDCRVDDGSRVGTALNATPLGLRSGDGLPISEERLQGCKVAFDLVYAEGGTSWSRRCKELGMRAADGRAMLVSQGGHAFQRFFPNDTAPLEVMVAAVNRELST